MFELLTSSTDSPTPPHMVNLPFYFFPNPPLWTQFFWQYRSNGILDKHKNIIQEYRDELVTSFLSFISRKPNALFFKPKIFYYSDP